MNLEFRALFTLSFHQRCDVLAARIVNNGYNENVLATHTKSYMINRR